MSEMRMAELARRSGLSVATIKYYLREQLLQPGRRTSVNQAVYDEGHLERLRMIRAMARVAGLPLGTIREVVTSIESDPSALEAMAATQDALVGEIDDADPGDRSRELLAEVIAERDWYCVPASPAYRAALQTVAEAEEESLETLTERIDDYARIADDIARLDVDAVASAGSLDAMIRAIVLGSNRRRSLVDALVLLAQQHYANQLAP